MPAPIDPNTSFLGGGGFNIGQQQGQSPGLLDMLGNSGAGQQPFDQAAVDAEYARILGQPGWGNIASANQGALATQVMNNLGLADKGGGNGFWTQAGRGNVTMSNQAGAGDASIDDWRLLPPGWRNPQYMMRNGHIIDRQLTDPTRYLQSKGVGPDSVKQVGSGSTMGYPASAGYFNSDWYPFWPGQVDEWGGATRGIRG